MAARTLTIDEGAERSQEVGASIIRLMPGRSLSDVGRDDPQHAELARLVARMAGGDERALADLYDATVSRVYGLALRICRDTTAAEDVTGDVYYQCWNEACRYQAQRSRVITWLLMICRSRAIDALRAREAAFLHEAPDALADGEDQPGEQSPDDVLDHTRSSAALHAALAALAPIQRQIIGLAFFRGLSHQEIAAHARLPLGTVKAHIRRGIELLRRDLQR